MRLDLGLRVQGQARATYSGDQNQLEVGMKVCTDGQI